MSYKYKCDNCGKEIITDQKRGERRFCCRECQTEYYFWDHNEKVICKNCQKEFVAHKCYHKKFCCQPCKNEWMSKNNRGQNHPRYNSFEITCEWCGKKYYAPQNIIDKDQRHFCGTQCRREWFAKCFSKTEEFKLLDSQQAINSIKNGKISTQTTKPHLEISNFLNSIDVSHINEYPLKYYVVDIYLDHHNLMIEIMGDYWHCHPMKYPEPLYKVQHDAIIRDKRKHTYIKKYLDIEVLYVWESDIKQRIDVCSKLIELYIEQKGALDNYHSFNYSIKNGQLVLNDRVVNTIQLSDVAS